ncbi:MAG: response regulator [Alphaproteobacteria bacterium]
MEPAFAEFGMAEPSLKRVLLVEDDPRDAKLIQSMLEGQIEEPFHFEVVTHLSDALRRLEQADIDLVFLDLGLPDSQSFRESIARLREHSDTPIIVLTGQNDTTLGPACIHWGAEDFITKDSLEPSFLMRTAVHSVRRHWVTTLRLREIVRRFEDGSACHEAIADAAEPMVSVTAAGRVIFINDAACRFLGTSFETIAGADLLRHLKERGKDRRRRDIQLERIGDTVCDGQACHILLLSASRHF